MGEVCYSCNKSSSFPTWIYLTYLRFNLFYSVSFNHVVLDALVVLFDLYTRSVFYLYPVLSFWGLERLHFDLKRSDLSIEWNNIGLFQVTSTTCSISIRDFAIKFHTKSIFYFINFIKFSTKYSLHPLSTPTNTKHSHPHSLQSTSNRELKWLFFLKTFTLIYVILPVSAYN